MNVVGEPQ